MLNMLETTTTPGRGYQLRVTHESSMNDEENFTPLQGRLIIHTEARYSWIRTSANDSAGLRYFDVIPTFAPFKIRLLWKNITQLNTHKVSSGRCESLVKTEIKKMSIRFKWTNKWYLEVDEPAPHQFKPTKRYVLIVFVKSIPFFSMRGSEPWYLMSHTIRTKPVLCRVC